MKFYFMFYWPDRALLATSFLSVCLSVCNHFSVCSFVCNHFSVCLLVSNHFSVCLFVRLLPSITTVGLFVTFVVIQVPLCVVQVQHHTGISTISNLSTRRNIIMHGQKYRRTIFTIVNKNEKWRFVYRCLSSVLLNTRSVL